MQENNTQDLLSAKEVAVLKMIRDSKYHSVTVVKRDGKIEMLEGIERIEEKTRIIDVLKEHNYQNIELKQANGKIVCLNRTVKTKLI
ncbi:hypothetical protein [uncultured Winogradskyella sp.]|uniref:hypothetical protein n=1 Tax=uncultured Winogradskyella sp. TaxID=395353 RepID=UPI0030DBC6C9|tara:strand:- start:138600 stop:138860 length:261 start_codon:yes stop_codon:yes gene_type:complete